jgi:hypothetical protein
MNRIAILAASALLGCQPSTETFSAHLQFPGKLPDGTIPYHAGGQFVVSVEATIPDLNSTHALISLGAPVSSSGVTMPQIIALGSTDGGLVGSTVMTWPLGGPIVVYAQVAGATLAPESIELVPPQLTFAGQPLQSNGQQWLYPYCLESTIEDGNVSLHLDGAAFANGMADSTLVLAPGPCEGVPSTAHSHASYTAVPSGSSFHVTGTMANIPQPFVQPEVDVMAFVPPVITVSSPQTSFPGGAIIEVDVHVATGPQPPQGISVIFQSIPPAIATMVVPSTVTTNTTGDASAHFQMPAAGSIEIDASIGPFRGSKQF